MRKNLEIKTRIFNYDVLKWKAREYIKLFTDKQYLIEFQRDIYYKIATGRLKLRIINGITGNLIYYDRIERNIKRVSNYMISCTDTPDELRDILKRLYKVQVVIEKKREIFITKNIRIHLDRVKKLGDFLEFEIIYTSYEQAQKKMNELIKYFKLNEEEFIKNSYSDLIQKKL